MKSKRLNRDKTSKHGFWRYLFFRRHYHQWFVNPQGGKHFAKQVMYWLLSRMQAKDEAHRLDLAQLQAKDKRLQERIEALSKLPLLDEAIFHATDMKARLVKAVLPLLVIAEAFFNYIATLLIFPGKGLLMATMSIVLAICLTLMSILAAKYCFSALAPILERKLSTGHDKHQQWLRLGWTVAAFVLMTVVIVAISLKRALDIEGGAQGLLTLAMVLLAFIFSILIAGLYWDRERWLDKYRHRKEWMRLKEKRKALQPDMIAATQPIHHRALIHSHYAYLAEFVVYKENYNDRKGITQESWEGHYGASAEDFCQESKRLYTIPLPLSNNGTATSSHPQPQSQ